MDISKNIEFKNGNLKLQRIPFAPHHCVPWELPPLSVEMVLSDSEELWV